MKFLKAAFVVAAVATLAGCVEVPVADYAGPAPYYAAPAYYPAPAYYGPAFGVGVYGSYGHPYRGVPHGGSHYAGGHHSGGHSHHG